MSQTENGSKLKALIRNGGNAKPPKRTTRKKAAKASTEDIPKPLQFKGALIEPAKDCRPESTFLYRGRLSGGRPLEWFTASIGKKVYAQEGDNRSDGGFVGFITILNKAHALKLFKAQQDRFFFGSEATGMEIITVQRNTAKALADTIPSSPYPWSEYSYYQRTIITDVQVAAIELRPVEWFTNRIGKKIYVASLNYFNGPCSVQDEEHAKWLCETAQSHGYRFIAIANSIFSMGTEKEAANALSAELTDKKAVIPETEQSLLDNVLLPTTSVHKEAIKAIDTYLKLEDSEYPYDSTLYNVFKLLSNHGRWNGAEQLENFITTLKEFMFNPIISSQYIKQSDYGIETVLENFNLLEGFFKSMQEDKEDAEFDRYVLATRPHQFKEDFTQELIKMYNRRAKVAEAKKAVLQQDED